MLTLVIKHVKNSERLKLKIFSLTLKTITKTITVQATFLDSWSGAVTFLLGWLKTDLSQLNKFQFKRPYSHQTQPEKGAEL